MGFEQENEVTGIVELIDVISSMLLIRVCRIAAGGFLMGSRGHLVQIA